MDDLLLRVELWPLADFLQPVMSHTGLAIRDANTAILLDATVSDGDVERALAALREWARGELNPLTALTTTGLITLPVGNPGLGECY